MQLEGYVPFDEARAAAEPWPSPDRPLLEDARGSLPRFPLSLMSPTWSRWIADTAQSAGTPPDYVAFGLFAVVSALCGAGVVAGITTLWCEPLVLWQALVGMPSSGKSPALAAVRRPLADIEDELRQGDTERRARHALAVEQGEDPGSFVPTQLVVADSTMEALADVVSGNPRGVILWRDELAAWLANLNRYANGGSDRAHWLEAWAAAGVTVNRRSRGAPLVVPRFPVSIVGSIQPDRLAEALEGSDDGMAARFLYTWPDPPRYVPLMERRIPADDEALARLQLIARIAGTASEPRRLTLEHKAFAAFDKFLEELHELGIQSDGIEAGWLGKGRGGVARLAAVLALLRWSEEPDSGIHLPPETIQAADMTNAIYLWRDYLLPHARAVFYQAGRGDPDRLARRVARWLKASPRESVISRETIRRDILAQSISAATADKIVVRLEEAHFLRQVPQPLGRSRGRPSRRWQVNPMLRQMRA